METWISVAGIARSAKGNKSWNSFAFFLSFSECPYYESIIQLPSCRYLIRQFHVTHTISNVTREVIHYQVLTWACQYSNNAQLSLLDTGGQFWRLVNVCFCSILPGQTMECRPVASLFLNYSVKSMNTSWSIPKMVQLLCTAVLVLGERGHLLQSTCRLSNWEIKLSWLCISNSSTYPSSQWMQNWYLRDCPRVAASALRHGPDIRSVRILLPGWFGCL